MIWNRLAIYKINRIVNLSFSEPLSPYSWPCIRGLFRFLTTLINNYDKYIAFSIFIIVLFTYFFIE